MLIQNSLLEMEMEVDRRVSDFESHWHTHDEVRLEQFLLPPEHPLFEPILCELIRVDLELRWSRNRRRRLAHYRAAYPALFRNAVMVNLMAFEEYRQRVLADEPVDPREYERDFGIDTSRWPVLHGPSAGLSRCPGTV